ncbi:hypothetical protein BN1708_015788 [Verticillium longisporum]|uniref:Uncharacterized protein n=1 Tax=Verticillium longisporum TaxID=100787 RepID=A0A0G4M8B8_VERLO|nr:hypothetical protein BN1708_015788 [Verticillium longisporum]
MTMNQIYASRDWGSITAVSGLLAASKYRGRIVRHDTIPTFRRLGPAYTSLPTWKLKAGANEMVPRKS